VTIGEVIISSVLYKKLQDIQGLTIDTSAAALNGINWISSIPVSTLTLSRSWLNHQSY
jgi:hypothetical protein